MISLWYDFSQILVKTVHPLEAKKTAVSLVLFLSAVILYGERYTANPNPVRLTGNSLWVNSHREKPVFITGNPCSHYRVPVLITGSLFSLQGFPCKPLYFPVRDCSVWKLPLNLEKDNIIPYLLLLFCFWCRNLSQPLKSENWVKLYTAVHTVGGQTTTKTILEY